MGEGLGRGEKHLVCDLLRAACHGAETDSGENEHVVALPRHEDPALDTDRRERAAAGENRSAAGPAVSLLGRAFGLGGGVGEGKDDRALAVRVHCPDHVLGKSMRVPTGTDQDGRFDALDDLQQSGRRLLVTRIGELVLLQLAAS